MSVQIRFVDKQLAFYPDGVEVSTNADGTLKFVLDRAGLTIATLVAATVANITQE